MNVKNKAGRVRTAYLSGVNLPGTLWKWYAVRTLQTRKPYGRGNMPRPAEGFHKCPRGKNTVMKMVGKKTCPPYLTSGSSKGIPRGGVCYPTTHFLPTVTFLNYVEIPLRITRKPCGRGNMPRPTETGRVRIAYLSGGNLPGTLWKWYAVRTLQAQWVSKLKSSNRIFAALLFLALGILANPAYAITCTVTTTSVNFGNYTTTTATPNDSVGTVTTKCSNTGQTSISTDISLSTGFGTYAQRKMKSGSNLLNYNLYTNASRATVWTNVVPPEGHANYQVNTTPIDKIFSVFGRIPALQNVPIGTYTDTITVTVNY